jgi:hypothetical protein
MYGIAVGTTAGPVTQDQQQEQQQPQRASSQTEGRPCHNLNELLRRSQADAAAAAGVRGAAADGMNLLKPK